MVVWLWLLLWCVCVCVCVRALQGSVCAARYLDALVHGEVRVVLVVVPDGGVAPGNVRADAATEPSQANHRMTNSTKRFEQGSTMWWGWAAYALASV